MFDWSSPDSLLQTGQHWGALAASLKHRLHREKVIHFLPADVRIAHLFFSLHCYSGMVIHSHTAVSSVTIKRLTSHKEGTLHNGFASCGFWMKPILRTEAGRCDAYSVNSFWAARRGDTDFRFLCLLFLKCSFDCLHQIWGVHCHISFRAPTLYFYSGDRIWNRGQEVWVTVVFSTFCLVEKAAGAVNRIED